MFIVDFICMSAGSSDGRAKYCETKGRGFEDQCDTLSPGCFVVDYAIF